MKILAPKIHDWKRTLLSSRGAFSVWRGHGDGLHAYEEGYFVFHEAFSEPVLGLFGFSVEDFINAIKEDTSAPSMPMCFQVQLVEGQTVIQQGEKFAKRGEFVEGGGLSLTAEETNDLLDALSEAAIKENLLYSAKVRESKGIIGRGRGQRSAA